MLADFGVPLEDLGAPAPFASAHMSATTLLPLPCVRYKADQHHARERAQAQELVARANAHRERMEALRRDQETKMLGAQEKAKKEKIELYKHRYMRDARENWSRYQEEKAEAAAPGAQPKEPDWEP